MSLRRHPTVPIKIVKFSPDEILMSSSLHSSPVMVALAGIGVALLVASAIQGISGLPILPVGSSMMLFLGVLFFLVPVVLNRRVREISINGDAQRIYGLTDASHPLQFADINAIRLDINPETQRWTLILELRRRGNITLVDHYPRSLALALGENLSRLLARPLKLPTELSRIIKPQTAWTLPYSVASVRFPCHRLVLVAGLVCMAMMALVIFQADLMDRQIIGNLSILLLLSGLGTILVERVNWAYSQKAAVRVCVLILVLLGGISILGIIRPVEILIGLFPGVCLMLLFFALGIRRRKSLILLLLGIVCLAGGLVVGLNGIIGVYQVLHLDPGVVEKIVVTDDGTGSEWVVEKPVEIRPVVEHLNKSEMLRIKEKARSRMLGMEIVRPFGKNIKFRMWRVEAGPKTYVRYDLTDHVLGFELIFSSMTAPNLDSLWMSKSETYDFWPPAKEI